MKKYGLIGYPLSHSFSPGYFKAKFERESIENCVYNLYPLEKIAELDLLLKTPNLKGLNVTIPYKKQVFAYLDGVEKTAYSIGAVNTIKIENGKTTGYNTDVYGFEQSLLPLLKAHHVKALILGTGGASKAVEFVLQKNDIEVVFVSRNPGKKKLTYTDIDANLLNDFHVIVNTTPLGMSPNLDSCPDLPYKHLNERHLLYDLVYNPAETLFMKKGKAQNAQVKNGLAMLQLQAEKSWEIWNK